MNVFTSATLQIQRKCRFY